MLHNGSFLELCKRENRCVLREKVDLAEDVMSKENTRTKRKADVHSYDAEEENYAACNIPIFEIWLYRFTEVKEDGGGERVAEFWQ